MRAWVLGIALFLVGGVAQADQSGARSHFLSGLQLYSQGRYAAALVEYQAAWLTWEDPELLLDMAECNRHLGNVDQAREQYQGFLERAPHSPLRGSVERQLARLDRPTTEAPPPAELVAVSPARDRDARTTHAGLPARLIGIAGWTLSAAALAVGIYAWSEYTSLQGTAHNELVALHTDNPSSAEQAFFLNPSCSPPPSLVNSDAYRRDCTRGQQYSNTVTAMFVGSAAFAIAGTISYIVGAGQSARARERAVQVTPVVSLNGGSLQLRYTF
jgi:tetratricopeptide (TPR) repeat protein